MPQLTHDRFRRLATLLAVASVFWAGSVRAGDLPATRPLLEGLNRETQTLFKEVAGSIVRVELPLGDRLTGGLDDPLAKWAGQLDPQTRQKLEDLHRHAPDNTYHSVEIRATTNPSGAPGGGDVGGAAASGGAAGSHIILSLSRFTPNAIGLVFDDQQHLLIPRFVEKDAFDGPVPLALGDGRLATATFVGSDRLADLTVLKLQDVKARPATLAPGKPDPGTLLLVMSLNPAANRLAVWEGWEPDFAAVINIDGGIAGFTKGGRFCSAVAAKPVVAELIDHGWVRRAFLGVAIQSVLPNDPQRQLNPALGTTPALRVNDVIGGSAAQRGGLEPGDLILTLAGESVGDAPSFAAAIANRRGKTDMTLLRGTRCVTVSVDLQVQ
jgi:S1-C subfamily serine protease